MDKQIPGDYVVSNQEALKTAAMKTKWNHFIENSTLHGMQYVFNGQTKARSIIWAVFLLGGMAYFSFQCSKLLTIYFRYPITTKLTLEYEQSPKFPAVTLCNFNMVSRSRTRKFAEELINWVFKEKQLALKGANFSAINWKDYENISIEEIYYDAGHQIKDMLGRCTWSGHQCSDQNFTLILTSMGLCYTFNSGKDGQKILSVKNSGVNFGLRLMLSVEQIKYYGFTAWQAGFKVLIHDQGTPPMIEELGFSVGPGTSTFAAIKKLKVKNLEAPFATNCSKDAIPGFSNYTTSSCMLTCQANHVIETCGCRDIKLPENFYLVGVGNCNCPAPCEAVFYQPVLSYASFPSNDLMPAALKDITQNVSAEVATKLFRENVLELDVYFQDLNYQLIEQQPAYDKASVFGEIGGQLGLCIGASLLTILEFCDVIFTVLKIRFGRRAAFAPSRQITLECPIEENR